MLAKLVQFVKNYQSDIILVVGVILISLLSFAMGYIFAKQQEKEPINIESGGEVLLRFPSSSSRFAGLDL
jgi:hypothetical protein